MVVFCNYLSIMLLPIWGGWEGLLGRLCFPKVAEFLCVLCVKSLRSLRLKRIRWDTTNNLIHYLTQGKKTIKKKNQSSIKKI